MRAARGAYPTIDREFDRMGTKVLLHRRQAKAIARKAKVRLSAAATALPDVRGTFSMRNDPTGYVLDYPAGAYPFPDGTASMTRHADLTGVSEARLLATVVSGGAPDVSLDVSGAGELISVVLEAGADALVVGAWHSVTESGSTALEWSVTATDSGTVTVGLCQLEVR